MLPLFHSFVKGHSIIGIGEDVVCSGARVGLCVVQYSLNWVVKIEQNSNNTLYEGPRMLRYEFTFGLLDF